MFSWSFGSFSFFMVPYYLDSMKANFFMLSLASEIAEFLGSVVCLFISAYMDLRRALFLFQSLVAVGCLAMIFVVKPDDGQNDVKQPLSDNLASAGLIMVTNLGVVISFDLAYLINPQLFPTILLATAYGVLNVFGRLITIISPIIAKLSHPFPLLFLIVYASLGASLSFCLKNQKL